MKKVFSFCAFFILCFAFSSMAQSPSWAVDIAPILYKSCTSCHHTGGLGPFPLMTYQEAFNNKSGIESATDELRMPPWPPEKGWGSFAHERTLTPSQIQTIKDWVAAGAVSGDLTKAPQPPVYNGGITITNPDLEVIIPTYKLKSNVDEYRCFAIKPNITTNEFITGIEVIPGNTEVVHHVLVFQDPTNTPLNLDAADPDPGYVNFGGTGSNTSRLIGAWVPGMQPTFYPPNCGVKMPANTNIVLQVHYPAGKQGKSDSTRVRFKLNTGAYREIFISPELNHDAPVLQNGPLFIPANQTKTFIEKYTVPVDASVLDIGPHMHLIGRSIKVFGILPNKDTLKLINIKEWDFHWQGFYPFKTVTKIPKGTILYAEAFYDNTTNNPENPNNPPQDVSLGEATTDEMMLVYFSYMAYQNGDKNINLDTMFYKSGGNFLIELDAKKDIHCSPNPNNGNFSLYIHADAEEKVNIYIYDMQGKRVEFVNNIYQLQPQENNINLALDKLPQGNYMIRVIGAKTNLTTQFVRE